MKNFYPVIAIVLLFSACGKNDQQVATSNSFCFPGFVRGEDVRNSAGVGWVITKEYGEPFAINNLGIEFRQSDLAVNVCLEETKEKLSCNCSSNVSSVYRIISISWR